MNIKTEEWNGRQIRFVEHKGEWWAYRSDINSLLEIGYTARNFDADNVDMIVVDGVRTEIINELEIYNMISCSHNIKAIHFQRWTTDVMKKLRELSGLKQYEMLRMLDDDIQEDINHILDTLYYDDSTGKIMRSVTVQGGDVEQEEFL